MKESEIPAGSNKGKRRLGRGEGNGHDLSKVEGDKIDLETLKQAGLIRPNSKNVKLLGTGDVDKAYSVDVTLTSKSAKEKIEAAGGSFVSD